MALIDDIRENRCILFTGPFMGTYEQNGPGTEWVSHTELYCTELQNQLQQKSIPYDANARNDPYYLASKWLRTGSNAVADNLTFVDKAYRRSPSLYKALSVIPFNTVVNFGFDHLMKEALDAEHYEFAFRYYNYKGDEVANLGVDKDLQLVYNLFGSIDDRKSRIVTEQNQLDFLKGINGIRKLPNDLLCRIRDESGPEAGGDGSNDTEKKSYIFLGFDFKDWPYRFLLDTLGLPKSQNSFTLKPQEAQIAVMAHEFFSDRFGIHFLEQSPKDFIGDLVSLYRSNATNHQYGYLSYAEEEDEETRKDFKKFLKPSRLAARINFWDKSLLLQGDNIKKAVAENLAKATVYVPFISDNSITDEGFYAEMNAVKERNELLFFPVICNNCLWSDRFPWLEKRASIILPGKDEVLNSSQKKASNEDYLKIIRTINSKIR